ncbi:cytidylate kinase [Orenia metallireducens]|uniref:Cytidylate kinase n=1 Tax=Orenia metallireducens TaxID=1413210 RepID=A0A285H624_9FIRM|nr:(d)CMP kinase [Orenia metallireducens]PRX29498.1 cytidylate kinase [Orenia metallireducens]SNY30256.1 cytidylate kinase [Orenia metallireducens]
MNLEKDLVIAIDGPAGAGKSTVAKIIAERLGYIYIDTGAMYRALTLKVLNQAYDLEDEKKLGTLAENTDIKLVKAGEDNLVLLDGEDVTAEIRDNKVSNNVSVVAKVAKVREEMVKLQRQMAQSGGVVMDGRDIGTVVLPDADIKIFLTASVEERAQRRYDELIDKGEDVDLEQIKGEIIRRDDIDKNREVAPLTEAEDAIYVDTTKLDIGQVVEEILNICQEV